MGVGSDRRRATHTTPTRGPFSPRRMHRVRCTWGFKHETNTPPTPPQNSPLSHETDPNPGSFRLCLTPYLPPSRPISSTSSSVPVLYGDSPSGDPNGGRTPFSPGSSPRSHNIPPYPVTTLHLFQGTGPPVIMTTLFVGSRRWRETGHRPF